MLLDDPMETTKFTTEKTVTITEKEYFQLLKDSQTLEKLYAGGVDNWEFFEDCFKD